MSESTGTNVVDVYINYLRRKLESGGGECVAGDSGHGPETLIRTVRGVGYAIGGVTIPAAATMSA